jgi:hypothetical protein
MYEYSTGIREAFQGAKAPRGLGGYEQPWSWSSQSGPGAPPRRCFGKRGNATTRDASCGKLYASDISAKVSMGDDIDPVTLAKPNWRRNSGVAEPDAEQTRMVTGNVEAITDMCSADG